MMWLEKGVDLSVSPEHAGSDVAADQDVGQVGAVGEPQEGFELGSHKDRNGHDDRQQNQEDRTEAGHQGAQLLLARLK